MCRKGEFCPPGTTSPKPCTPGFFCSEDSLANVSGICDPGYYCSGSTIEQRPVGKSYGDICPPGHYCEAGSSAPTACREGYFARGEGNNVASACQLCKYSVCVLTTSLKVYLTLDREVP